MKKKFNLLVFIIALLNFSLFSLAAFSDSKCKLFFNELNNNFTKYLPDEKPMFEYNDFGFELKVMWDEVAKKWVFDQNQDGYFKVGRITHDSLIGKVSRNDLIISVNNKDLREMDLNQGETYFEDSFQDNEVVNFKLKNSKIYNLELDKKKRDLFDPFNDIYIHSLDINEKINKINARIELDSSHSFTDDEDLMYIKAMEDLYFETDDGVKGTERCDYDAEEWDKSGFGNPAADIEFLNLHSIDYNRYESVISIRPYSEDIKWQKDLGWGNELYVNFNSIGSYVFNSNFRLNSFPFDRQKIIFQLVAGDVMEDGLLSVSDYSKKYLKDLEKKNSIVGWNIIDTELIYEPWIGPTDTYYSSSVKIQIEVERKYGYYLYKVILPIVLILMICWSSIWIPARELESKLTITIVCLLSLIAYNFVIDKDIPKLEYLTILDWIILISYFYATVPNFLSVYAFRLYKNKENKLLNRLENQSKRFGALSYLAIILIITMVNVAVSPENSASLISWMAGG